MFLPCSAQNDAALSLRARARTGDLFRYLVARVFADISRRLIAYPSQLLTGGGMRGGFEDGGDGVEGAASAAVRPSRLRASGRVLVEDHCHDDRVPQGAALAPVVTPQVCLVSEARALVELPGSGVVGPHLEGHLVASAIACPVHCGRQ